MLKYIFTVTEDLLIPVTIICLMYALFGMIGAKRGRACLHLGVLFGLAASVCMAVVKNTTRLIYTNQWNLWIFIATVVVSVLFALLAMVFCRKEGAGQTAACALGGILAMLLIFYEMPDVMAYPFLFDTAGNGILSVDYLVRLIGWMLALILITVYMRYLYRCTIALHRFSLLLPIVCLTTLVNAVRCFGQALRPWLTRGKWLPDFFPVYTKADYPWVFPLSSFVANNTLLFCAVIAGLALLIPIVLFFCNLRSTEPYSNPAQRRKLKSTCIRNRRRAITVAVCFALAMVNLTVVKAYDRRVIELSPPEEYAISDGNVTIPLTQLEDGHLHRYEYTSENGIAIRWIIIKKPGSASYGVGLDACEVCGDAGYYERNGQVVCKRCDVVMNINTIGFRGGCNPIPLEYRVADGQLLISLDAVTAGEKEFK